jgi:hypothetical protein
MSEDLAVYDADVTEVSTPIADTTLINLAEQAEKRIDAMNKIKRVAIKLTNVHDWVDQGGKPYIQVSGAEKIARMFGISWRISEPVKDNLEGGHFSYTYKGYFSLAGATIEAIGTRSSKDGFFKKYKYVGSEKTELPASEIDAGDVKKSAYTNLIGNGITRLLGIRNLTYDDLKEFAGITPEMIGKVDYKKSGKQQSTVSEEGAQKIKGVCGAITKRTKKKDGTAMKNPLYVIPIDGKEYTTFSESFLKVAKDAFEAGLPVEITYTTDQKFGSNNVDAIIKCEPEAQQEPKEEPY